MFSCVDFAPAMVRGNIHPDSKAAVAERLLVIRMVKGWTQETAAKRIGESQATWGWWEVPDNVRRPTGDQLRAIELATSFPREWVQSGISARVPPKLEEKIADAIERIRRGERPRKRKR